jgi:hypothetical protein
VNDLEGGAVVVHEHERQAHRPQRDGGAGQDEEQAPALDEGGHGQQRHAERHQQRPAHAVVLHHVADPRPPDQQREDRQRVGQHRRILVLDQPGGAIVWSSMSERSPVS